MRLLVTGASGLLGLNLALEASREHEVFGSVNRNEIRNAPFTVIQSDLTRPGSLEDLFEASQPDWVINCAALANLDACEAKPALAKKLNIELPEKLAQYVAKGGARLVHISTDAVFDGKGGEYTETDKPNPLSTYARTKLLGEEAVSAANPQAIVARVNLFGWSLSGQRSLAEWFLNNLAAQNQISGFTDVYFCPLLVNDLANLLLEMLGQGLQGLYHVVARDCASKYDFGVQLARLFGYDQSLIKPTSISDTDFAAARSLMLTLKSDKLARELGESPPDLQTCLERFHQQYLSGYPEFIQKMRV
ncbi:MAG: SDR family oxidoreductase [Anaerolineales bacterium]|nr:SDR family oxidoreductase [Anaerolineales bacterium]